MLVQENEELQMGMMDQTVDMAQTIMKQLSELSAINSKFALEMSIQHEVEERTKKKKRWEILMFVSFKKRK